MAEFVFNGNANIYTAAQGQHAAAAAAVSNVVALKQEDNLADSSQLRANRQVELLLWLANLELRLPPYGDNN
ncbi:hypothetical protein KBI23_05160 [bacterium]|nr:hypothetical protein [bacterium]MBP9807947.1 hypothetical protein [bacterium]